MVACLLTCLLDYYDEDSGSEEECTASRISVNYYRIDSNVMRGPKSFRSNTIRAGPRVLSISTDDMSTTILKCIAGAA